MGKVIIDERRFPVVVVRYDGDIDDAEFARHLADFEESFKRWKGKRVVIADASGRTNTTPASQRRMQAEWIKRNQAVLAQQTLATLFVIDNVVVRGVLTAILWLQPMPMPHRVVRTMKEALDIAHATLGLSQSPLRPN